MNEFMPSVDHLTQREREVLMHIGLGRRTKTIARILEKSPHTINKDAEAAMRKLGVSNRVAAAEILRNAVGSEHYEKVVYESKPIAEASPPPPLRIAEPAGKSAGLRDAGGFQLEAPLVRYWWQVRLEDLSPRKRLLLIAAATATIPFALGALLLGLWVALGLTRAVVTAITS